LSYEISLSGQDIFVATNTANVPAVAPNAAFAGDGSRTSTTLALQLVEGGIDVSSLQLGGNFDACNPQSTVTVKTRSSASFTSELKDYDILKFSATPPAEASVTAITPQCRDLSGSNTFSISGTYVGINPVWSTSTGTLSNQSYSNGVATATLTLPSTTAGTSATVTLTVQTDNPQCNQPGTDSKTATVNPLPTVSAGDDKVINCNSENGQVTLTATSTPAGTYLWTASNGGTIVGATNALSVVVSSAGTYTFRSTTANGCFATDAAVVTRDVAAPVVSAGDDQALSCDTHTAQLSGSSTTAGATFAWVASNGGHIVSGGNTATPTVDAAGTYTLTVTNPANGCTATDVALVTAPVCATYCTYTQGFYGNKNGLAMLPGLLTTPITIGRAGHSFTIPANTSMVKSAAKLNSIMPGGNTPAVLKAGDCSMMTSCLSQYLTNQGRINNVLLSQTITLTLNTRLKGGILSSFAIKSGYIVTQGGCMQLNSSVVNYLTANGTKLATVSDLLNLANDVLGGTKTAGAGGVPSLSNINSVIDAINNIFDECKSFSGYFSTCPFFTTSNTSVRVVEDQLENLKALKLSTYPNPYNDKVRFVIQSPNSGKASLEVYNMLGQKLHTVFQGDVQAGTSQTYEYAVPEIYRSTLIYLYRQGDKIVTGKLLQAKK